MNNCLTLVVLMFSAAMIPLPEQKGSDLIATVKKHGGNKQNEDWHGSERRGRFAAFPARFSSRKSFYDLRLDLRFVWYNGCELNDMYQTH